MRASKDGYALQLDVADITRELTDHLQGLESKVEKAIDRAIVKTARWLRTHSVKEIGKALGIKNSVIRNRYRFRKVGEGNAQKVDIWVGLLAIAAHEAGKPVQNKVGTRAAGREFKSAFIAKIFNSEERVFIRSAANEKQNHTTLSNPQERKIQRFMPEKLKGRFPVEVVGVDILEVSLEVLERYEKRINKRYSEILQQELNYALNVKD
jgi:hypothetical protein